MGRLAFARPISGIVIVALVLVSFLMGALPAQALVLAYDSQISGRLLGPDDKPAAYVDVVVYTEADRPFGQGSQDMGQRTSTDASGRFKFKADSRTVYKVRFIDYGFQERKPFTFADKWVGGKSNFDDAEGYNSAKEIVLKTPGVIDLGTEVASYSTLPPFQVSSKPSIIGEPRYGEELFATPGSWSPVPLEGWDYTWLRGNAVIGHGQTYRVKANDVGREPIHVVVDAVQWSVARYTEAKSDPVSIPPVTLPVGAVTIGGKAQVGHRVTAIFSPSAGQDASSLNALAAPQWYRNGTKISGAHSMAYDVTPADAGSILSFGAGGGIAHSPVHTAKIAPGTIIPWTPTLGGSEKVDSTLTARIGNWKPVPVEFKYQWYRSGKAIEGADSQTYKLSGSDAGKTFKVRVTGSKLGYSTAADYSKSTRPITKGTLATKTPGISGTKKVGKTLTAKPGTWTSGTIFKYQWYRSGKAIKGADNKTYKLTGSDAGKTIKVRVIGSKIGYTTITKYSASTSRLG